MSKEARTHGFIFLLSLMCVKDESSKDKTENHKENNFAPRSMNFYPKLSKAVWKKIYFSLLIICDNAIIYRLE
jgi:hypothetical protein